ncbi:hypothetical protein MNBD_NITROSPINAE02-1813 [hydrothermal vent metagenome]|uniref:Glycosyltransferase 2-like domain-containing protein n=1 Tax=hydrothermal vent metagenome TaxID=652676 RepID=A0A3B1C501_9ZZZZ
MRTSFIIISGGQRPASVTRLINSIRAQRMTDYEIILVGRANGELAPNVQIVDEPKLADNARICRMRNIGIEKAGGDIVVLLDDDVELSTGWYGAIAGRLAEPGWDIAGCKTLGPSGERWYDWCWASRVDPHCPPRLLKYGERSDNLYISGCLMIIRKKVFDKLKFDENLANHMRDDVDFCHRAIDAGSVIVCWPEAEAIHHLEPAGRNEADPASGEELYTRAIHLLRKKEYGAALEMFLLQSPAPKVLYHAALAQKELGQNKEALDTFEEFLSEANLDDNEERRLYYTAQFHVGRLMEKEGWNVRARQKYKEALSGFPEHKDAREGLQRLTNKSGSSSGNSEGRQKK